MQGVSSPQESPRAIALTLWFIHLLLEICCHTTHPNTVDINRQPLTSMVRSIRFNLGQEIDSHFNVKQFWRTLMPVNFDSIQPVSSVTVTTSRNNDLVKVEFARVLDQDVMTDMQGLKLQPFVSFFFLFSSQKTFDITVGSNYHLGTVAEAIAQILEGHGLDVKRREELGSRKVVSSFTPQ